MLNFLQPQSNSRGHLFYPLERTGGLEDTLPIILKEVIPPENEIADISDNVSENKCQQA